MIELTTLQSSPEVADLLDWPFDFSLIVHQSDIDETTLSQAIPYHVIGTDGCGGVFVAYGSGPLESLPILHGTSEGQAGKVALNLTDWISLLVSLPYWRDLLKFSSGGNLASMRDTSELMARSILDDCPELPNATARLRQLLQIPQLDDPIEYLHCNVHSTDCTLVDADGDEWDGLFNTFDPAVLRRSIKKRG